MKKELYKLLEDYKRRALHRKEVYNLPPRPLREDEVKRLIECLKQPALDREYFTIFKEERVDKLFLRLLKEEVRRGSFPSSYAKARGLAKVIKGEIQIDYLTPGEALDILAGMRGGAASGELINIIKQDIFVDKICDILKQIVLINKEEFAELTVITNISEKTEGIIKSWAEREFAAGWQLQESYEGITIKVGDNVTTGHISPSKRADSRTDHPLHAQYIMEGREDEADFLKRWQELKAKNENVILAAGKSFGEGSSRKSATYTIQQILGRPFRGEPEKKEGGIIVAKSFAPIFKESLVASGILPVICNTSPVREGDIIVLDIINRKLIVNNNKKIDIELPPRYKLEKIAAGGMTYFDAGNELQKWAIEYCRENNINFVEDNLKDNEDNLKNENIDKVKKSPQTLAQKIVAMNRLDNKDTIVPGETAPVKVRGVFSQDTTGPMTINAYQAMGGQKFGADFVVQSLCHTGECPSSEERDTHKFIYDFITGRGGVCLNTGEGIIHTIGNRFVLPTDVIFGGDSHTRTPRGVSFPAASDIVAGTMKYGKINLTMDESVKVIFKGRPKKGITARDLLSALVIYAEKTVGKDIYNSRIIEIEGVEFLNSDERYILTNSVAERNASAGVIKPDETTIQSVEENLEYLKSRPDADKLPSMRNAIRTMEEFLKNPVLPEADPDAEYATVIEIPLDEVEEPLVAKPHHPDNVAEISEVSGTEIDEVFIGSCVGGDLESIRAAARIVKGKQIAPDVNFVVSPAARDIYARLAGDSSLSILSAAGATVIMPGCGLCMGNKRRIGSGATAFTTTTRNYQSRIGPEDSQTYLGSAHVAAMTGILGKLPTKEEYFRMYR